MQQADSGSPGLGPRVRLIPLHGPLRQDPEPSSQPQGSPSTFACASPTGNSTWHGFFQAAGVFPPDEPPCSKQWAVALKCL